MALEFGVKIEGLDRLLKKYGKDEFDRAAQAGLEAGMQIAVNGAKRRLQGNVKTGALRNSITFQRRGMDGWVGSNLNYARWVEEGTGVYGPMKRPFGPRRAKVMRWTPKTPTGAPGKGPTVYRRSVRGQPGKHFLRDTVMQDKAQIIREIETRFWRHFR